MILWLPQKALAFSALAYEGCAALLVEVDR